MAFDQAAVLALLDSAVSHAMTLGIFETVNTHEPKSKPGSGIRLAIWVDSIVPVGAASGQASVSGYVTLNARVYGSMLQKPEDEIDPSIMTAIATLMGAYCGDFDFGGTIRNIDLLGMYGTKMAAQAGYITIANAMYRIMTLTVPCVINDMWTEVA